MIKERETFSDLYSYRFGLNEETGFFNELNRVRGTQTFHEADRDTLQVVTAEQVAENNLQPEVEDTIHHGTGLCLSNGPSVIPVRGNALTALDNLIGVNGRFLGRLTADEHAELLNRFVIPKLEKGYNLLLFEEDKKVTGCMNKKTYSSIPAEDVFNVVKSFMDVYFEQAVFKRGCLTHEGVWAEYDLSKHAADFNAVLNGVRYAPVFSISTSDAGFSSITIRPYLATSSLMLPVSPLRVCHRGTASLNDVREALNECYSLIDKGISSLSRLSRIRIDHPHTTLLRAMKACKIQKKPGLQVAENHKLTWGPDTTALDLYKAVCETLLLVDANQTPEQKFRCEDDVARCCGLSWEKYDLPGDFSW